MTIKRMTFLQELLDFVGLKGRLHLEWISSAEAQKFVQVVTDFTERLKALGPSPINEFADKVKAFLGPRPVYGARTEPRISEGRTGENDSERRAAGGK
jgi:F420-non-reducing hydrogenase iron-sulfur subunit